MEIPRGERERMTSGYRERGSEGRRARCSLARLCDRCLGVGTEGAWGQAWALIDKGNDSFWQDECWRFICLPEILL